MTLEPYLTSPQFSLPQAEKERLLLRDLNDLTAYHRDRCPPYARLLNIFGGGSAARSLAELPYLPVSLFKTHDLASVDSDPRNVILTSSGTTGQAVSRIVVDAETADRQARALNASIAHLLGPKRLPMIIADTKTLLRDPRLLSARGAGVLGMMRYGHGHFFALDEEMRLDAGGLKAFLTKWSEGPILLFGFTFMVWKYLFEQLVGTGLDFSRVTLVHSGGWKKLLDEAVDNATFRARWREETGLVRCYNFYGMVEQIGSIFLEGEDGLLYPPNGGDVIIRDPVTWRPSPPGAVGVIQVLSVIPRSYPGHSLLTEDLGILHHVDRPDSSGRYGKAISVVGRAPKTELRGCSDVHGYGARGKQ